MFYTKSLKFFTTAFLVCLSMLWIRHVTLAEGPHGHTEIHAVENVESLDLGTAAVCSGGTAPSVPGPVTLNLCYQRDFNVGGNARTVRVWYITNTTVYTVGPEVYQHWVSGESQASDVADAVVEAWQAVYVDSAIGGSAHEPYINGCSSVLNIQLEDGKGWSGIAYWGSSGNCNIGIDSPMILDGVGTGDDGVIAHEIQHYTQYSYDNGCYDDFRPLYPSNSWIEGWSNWAGKNSMNTTQDANYSVSSYGGGTSYYDLSYTNLHQGYLMQQYGHNGSPGDRNFGVKAVYEHYRQCDTADDIFVMDQTISALTSGAKNERTAFLDFVAAYYAYPYADTVNQPELTFPDSDDKPTGTPGYAQNVSMSGGTNSWTETSPNSWTVKYYRVTPTAGCDFVELHVETSPPGGTVGINFMATKTTGTPSILRSAHIGDNATRFFAGAGSNNELVVAVNSFDTATTYDVEATCIIPTLTILEPVSNPGHAMVGAHDAPIATLTRFKVTGTGGLAVSGIAPSEITFNAEGAAPTLVAGSFQEVGPGEYWAVIVPPVKPIGTTFVDYQVCLNVSICDTKTDALLYVDPGNSDVALAIDESGSMATEDTPGEGTRIANAKKAGNVVADLLRVGDRTAILGFGGSDIPPGCGLPPDGSGTGNCPDATIIRLARTDVVGPATIVAAKAAIATVDDRPLWTNIGRALVNAKNVLLNNPGNSVPDYIYLLSDGRENVLPMYADVKVEIQNSGVRVNTIGFGPEAPGALLAQIAADTGGTYRPVPTSGLGTSSLSIQTLQLLNSQSIPTELADITIASSPFLPGQLGLADVYDWFDTQSQGGSRIFHVNHVNVPRAVFRQQDAVIDETTTSFQFVVAAKQEDSKAFRVVEVLPPGEDPQKGWIPISPVGSPPAPGDWDIRNGEFEDVLIVPKPTPGVWEFRVGHFESDGASFMMNLSVQTPIRLQGRLLGLNQGQGSAGDVVPVVATLMTRSGMLPGAFVLALIENEGGSDLIVLHDDGNNHDGGPSDGIYGWPYSLTEHGGSYNVRILALFPDPNRPTQNLIREWNGGFWIDGPQDIRDNQPPYRGDEDRDGMPDDWEKRCRLDVGRDDSKDDPDHDKLINIDELRNGTLPCRADTDHGGEQDGSEVNNNRNPLWPDDDIVRPVGHVQIFGFDKRFWINWSLINRADHLMVHVSDQPGGFGAGFDLGSTGSFTLTDVPNLPPFTNGVPYYLTFYRVNGDAEGAYSDEYEIILKEDPLPPQGAFLIGGPSVTTGGDETTSSNVVLDIDVTDTAETAGPASHSVAHSLSTAPGIELSVASGAAEMRFVNTNPELISNVEWEQISDSKAWTLDCAVNEQCLVYGQFRDNAGNESLVVEQTIVLSVNQGGADNIYLPVITKN